MAAPTLTLLLFVKTLVLFWLGVEVRVLERIDCVLLIRGLSSLMEWL